MEPFLSAPPGSTTIKHFDKNNKLLCIMRSQRCHRDKTTNIEHDRRLLIPLIN